MRRSTILSLLFLIATARLPQGVSASDDQGINTFHRLPASLDRLAIVPADALPPEALATLTQHGGELRGDRLPKVQIVEFADEAAMLVAQRDLKDRMEIPLIGPVLSEQPLVVLGPRIAVRFRSATAHQNARSVLDRFGLRETRALPYVEHGFVFEADEASRGLYQAAREMIERGDARYAVPILHVFRERVSAAPDRSRTDDQGSTHDYLQEMNVPDAWDAVRGRVDNVVIAVFDEGIHPRVWTELVCERLRLDAVVDFVDGESCASGPMSWCETCEEIWLDNREWCLSHGNSVGLTAAATHGGDDLRGVAPGARLIGAHDWDRLTDEQFADALWWLAGGDPGGANCPAPLDAESGAAVINLSFSRSSELETDCTGSGCELVCTSSTPCGLIEEVLARLRRPRSGDGLRDRGVVVVTAAGDEDEKNELATSPNTLAVGSVRFDDDAGKWSPFDVAGDSECDPVCPSCKEIHCFGDFVDLVAPLGSDDDNQTICADCVVCQQDPPGPTACSGACSTPSVPMALEFGAPSGAAAAVSGVVAMMFEVGGDNLSADQVYCILRETAQSRNGSGEVWEDLSNWADLFDCSFESERSACFGYGMVDAAAAVDAAKHCRSRSRHCPCPQLPPPAANDRPPRGKRRGYGKRQR